MVACGGAIDRGWVDHFAAHGLMCTAVAVTALLLLHHSKWPTWHLLAATGGLVGAGEAPVAVWSRSRVYLRDVGAEPPVGGSSSSNSLSGPVP